MECVRALRTVPAPRSRGVSGLLLLEHVSEHGIKPELDRHRIRDRLCVIRHHHDLDALLVKRGDRGRGFGTDDVRDGERR